MTCAFTSQAFASNAFTVCVPGGGGGARWLPSYLQLMARRARFLEQRKPVQHPTIEEVEELLVEARTRFRIVARPYVTTDLTPIVDRMRLARAEADFKEQMRLLANIDEWIFSDG